LPVSSTGHLILTSYLLGLDESEATKAFQVVIQSGAIFAVIWEYRKLLAKTCSGILAIKSESLHLFYLVLLAFLPAAVLGVLLSKQIKAHLLVETLIMGKFISNGPERQLSTASQRVRLRGCE